MCQRHPSDSSNYYMMYVITPGGGSPPDCGQVYNVDDLHCINSAVEQCLWSCDIVLIMSGRKGRNEEKVKERGREGGREGEGEREREREREREGKRVSW